MSFTKESLKNLNEEIMDEDFHERPSGSEDESEPENLLIGTIKRETNKKSRYTISEINLYAILMAQREQEIQRIIKLEKKYAKLQNELDRQEQVNHYLKMDLSNSNIERDESKDLVKTLKKSNIGCVLAIIILITLFVYVNNF